LYVHVAQGQHAYPGPLTELDFWAERAGNLNSIHDQLSSDRVQKVVKVLELARSTYHPAFERLFQVLAVMGNRCCC
jgi:dynein heavy chain